MEKEYFRNKIYKSLIFSFAFLQEKSICRFYWKLPASNQNQGKTVNVKTLSKSQASLETYKVYSEKTVDLKMCTSPKNSKKTLPNPQLKFSSQKMQSKMEDKTLIWDVLCVSYLLKVKNLKAVEVTISTILEIRYGLKNIILRKKSTYALGSGIRSCFTKVKHNTITIAPSSFTIFNFSVMWLYILKLFINT